MALGSLGEVQEAVEGRTIPVVGLLPGLARKWESVLLSAKGSEVGGGGKASDIFVYMPHGEPDL